MSEPGPSSRRRAGGWAAGLLVALLVAYPLFLTWAFSAFSFSGCFIDCSGSPSYGGGLLYSLMSVVLLGAPVVVGLAVGGARTRRTWLTALAVVVLVVAGAGLLAVLSRAAERPT